MNVFEFRQNLVNEYAEFTRSFTRIKADDIRAFVDAEYGSQKYWPEPLVQINPNFQPGGTVVSLCAAGQLSPQCAEIFRFGKTASSAGHSLPLYKHQVEAICLAAAGESYVLTTGTGSGKSLSYFIPIVDACLKAKATDKTPRTRAIVVYPMNALANSQLEELKKFLGADPGTRAVTFGRFTGQESTEEREAMKANPPDILLTNFMMLELLLTRQNAIDQQVIANAKGLRFLVLDELHTYRGRQGVDVALLVRRVREALADQLVCIGTSATMATDGTEMERNAKVAEVATRLFGTRIPVTNIITETLKRTTPETETDVSVKPLLAAAIQAGVPSELGFEELARHPVSIWVELTLGLTYESGKPRRAKPKTLAEAARLLSEASGLPQDQCSEYLQQFLLRAYNVTDASGKSLFAFKLHQFISGGGKVFSTLEAPGIRTVTLDGQQFVSGDRSRHLYNMHFCRDCGQEFIPVWDQDGVEGRTFAVRSIEEREHEDDGVKAGYLMPDLSSTWDPTNPENYPETWVEERADGEWRVKPTHKKYPVGFFLFWETGAEGVETKVIGEANKQKTPSLLIVDGQQRLTSLYAVMRREAVLRENFEREYIRIAFRPQNGTFVVPDATTERDPEYILDISEVFNRPTHKTIGEYLKRLSGARTVGDDEEEQVAEAIGRLAGLTNFPFIALELSQQCTEEQVADVFVRINSEGKKLNQSDFILTLMSVFWDDGRTELETFCRAARQPASAGQPSPFNQIFQPDPDHLLRVDVGVAFRRARLEHVYSLLRGKDLSTGEASPEKRTHQFAKLRDAQSRVLNLTYWADFLNIVRAAGYRSAKTISSVNALVFAYQLYLLGRTEYGVEGFKLKNAIARWLFMSLLTGRFTASPESRMEQDLAELRDLKSAEQFLTRLTTVEAATLTDDFWTKTLPLDLATSAGRSPALFGFYAAQTLLGARALFSKSPVADLLDPPAQGQKKALERHHLFPRQYLKKLGYDSVRDMNQIANYALVEWDDNIAISDGPPSSYWPEYAQRFDDKELAKMCDWHALPDNWWTMSYPEFLAARRPLIAGVIRAGYQKLVGNSV